MKGFDNMFRLESLDFTTNYTEFKENVDILRTHLLFNELTINVEYVNYQNVFDREIVEIKINEECTYDVNIYDYSTKDVVFSDMKFERLDEIVEYLGKMYFEDEFINEDEE